MAKIYHNLDIDWKKGCFYQYSKTDQEGFEKHVNSAGTESYRKYFNAGVYGTLQSVQIDDTPMGKKLSVRLMDGEDIFIARIPLYDQRSNIDNNFAEPLITLLPNMEKNQAYRIFPWIMEREEKGKNGKPRKSYGVSVKVADLDQKKVLEGDKYKVEPKFSRRKKEEEFNSKIHIPDLVFEEEFGSFKPTALSLDTRKKFLVDLLNQSLDVLGYKKEGSSEQQAEPKQQKEAPKKKEQPKTDPVPSSVIEDEDYDDLPF